MISNDGYAEIMKSIVADCQGIWHLRKCAILRAEFGWFRGLPTIRGLQSIWSEHLADQPVAGTKISNTPMHMLPRLLGRARLNYEDFWNYRGMWGVYDYCDDLSSRDKADRLVESMVFVFQALLGRAEALHKRGQMSMANVTAPSDPWFLKHDMSPTVWWAVRSMLLPGSWPNETQGIHSGGPGLVCASCDRFCSFPGMGWWLNIFDFGTYPIVRGFRNRACDHTITKTGEHHDGWICQFQLKDHIKVTLGDEPKRFALRMESLLSQLLSAKEASTP